MLNRIKSLFKNSKNETENALVGKILAMYAAGHRATPDVNVVASALGGKVVYIQQAAGHAVFPVAVLQDHVLFFPRRCTVNGARLNKQAWQAANKDCTRKVMTFAGERGGAVTVYNEGVELLTRGV